ncbi:E3 ubiquitin-protein ligase RNF168-like isoform X2 [Aphis gossypii]|uniref:E3 ubiquitin-protein ligase RNF168-like isoform X2 n=1 Tax=Aphis gossypii TaxID=80765 RepID=UPI002158B73B|nr:E3 ubiquitin-protein ligase RNF168-like isoform X2 [Aphis gossypii]
MKTKNQTITMNSKKIEKKLGLEEVFCIACRCIYLQPVTMPCGHTLCLECFKNMVNLTAYQCPICRRRISNWLRKFKHDWNAMLNVNFWEAIKQQYPVEVQKRLNDEDDGLEERIVNHDFSRIELKEGEIKKEFDDMQMNINKEQREKELHSLELAKKLQEEEEAINQTQILLNEELTREDCILATKIQENITKELLQEEKNLIQSDMDLATKLNDQIILTQIPYCVNNPASKKNQIKRGPLDKIFSKTAENNSKIQWNNNTQDCSLSLSSTVKEAISKSSIQSSNASLSSFSSDLCTSSSTFNTSEIFENENLDTCTCGRLEDKLTRNSPCAFCIAQIELLNKLWSQQQNDFMIAKNLEKKLRMSNFEDYNLRKRSNSSVSLGHKKKRKLSKGQLTLKQVLKDSGNTLCK